MLPIDCDFTTAILHLNNNQCNIAFEQYSLQYCTYEQYSVQFCYCWTTIHCIKIHKHNSIMHCKALNQDLKIQQSTEFTYAGVALPCSTCGLSDDPYFTLYTYPTICNCTFFCFPCLILLSMQAAPSFAYLHCLTFYLNGCIIYRNLITPLLSR